MDIERDARDFGLKILELAREIDVDSSVFVLAMADTIGVVAALNDRDNPQDIEERLKILNDRIRQRYYSARVSQVVPASMTSAFQLTKHR